MYPHRIRLRHPWQCEGLDASRARFTRRFGYPGQIDNDERVWLTLADLAGPSSISLNGALLTETTSACAWLEQDVTTLLLPRNELRLEMPAPAERVQPWSEVALEVRCLAFLRGMQVEVITVEGRLELDVRGEVVGTADRPLDLYVLLDRYQAGYARVQARTAGEAFQLRCQNLPPEAVASRPLRVQIDLVSGARVWYTWTWQLA